MFVAHLEDQVSPERQSTPLASVVGRAKNILKCVLVLILLWHYTNVNYIKLQVWLFQVVY